MQTVPDTHVPPALPPRTDGKRSSAHSGAYVRICVHGPRGYTSISIGPRQLPLFCALARGSTSSSELRRIADVVRKSARAMPAGIPRGRFSSAVRRRALATLRRTYQPSVAAEFEQQQFPGGVPAVEGREWINPRRFTE